MKNSKGKQKTSKSEPPSVPKLTPDQAEAHDEGPRLIPQPGAQYVRAYFQHELPTDAAVALADRALAIWARVKQKK